jgi:MoaA/NifB/PqqE/SkfB family radical SAM enzyme
MQVEEFTLSEWSKVFDSLGTAPYWVTLSGGEPFLNRNLGKIYKLLVRKCRPAIVNIPTNGLLTRRIGVMTNCMSAADRKTKMVVNVSMDHSDPEKNDQIRGVDGAYGKALRTVRKLQENRNVTVGVHSVVSRFNVLEIGEVVEGLSGIPADPTHYITEIAENRVELGTVDLDITPGAEDYQKAATELLGLAERSPKTLIRAFRVNYYRDVLRWLRGEGRIPCYAGYSSAQITPDGEVVACCVRYESMGNLRDAGYDFGKVWSSERAKQVRENVKRCEGCPLANAHYTSSLLDVGSVVRVIKNFL